MVGVAIALVKTYEVGRMDIDVMGCAWGGIYVGKFRTGDAIV